MYTSEQDDEVLFQVTPDGQLELLETKFTKSLNKEITAFLAQCNSIPAFLSNITLDLFDKRTFRA